MTIVEPGGAPQASSGIVARIQGLLFRPTQEWGRIAGEPASVQGLYVGWLIPLALIPCVAMVVGMSVFGVGVPGLAVAKLPLLDAIVRAAVQFALLLAMTYLMAQIIDAIAPNFGAEKNPTGAMKVAAYSGVAMLLSGVFQLVPALGILGLLGLYSIYILNRGLGVVMKAAPEKATGYTASVVVIMLIAWIVAFWIVNAILPMNRMSILGDGARIETKGGGDRGSITIDGTTIDLGALEKAAKQIESATTDANGNVTITASGAAVDVERIRALLPERVAGLPRTEISTGGAAGMGGASAVYAAGDKRLEISVADMGAMGALGSMAGAFKVQSTRETADGYERARTVDGRMTIEKFSRAEKSASYGVMAGNRFMLNVDGRNVTPEEVKAAADSVGVARLEALAKAN
jgi:hypothetical protein